MSSKSALKKLKKKSKKLTSKSLKQLNALTANSSKVTYIQPQLKKELGQLSEQVVGNVVSELIQPLNPLLSWFRKEGVRDGGFSEGGIQAKQPQSAPTNRVNTPTNSPANEASRSAAGAVQIQPRSIAQVPLKSPPCKRCPALAGGNCKCAMKKFNISL
ncbi:hypothetical protein L2737_16805 [Shewanella electrodiphila]|uniref:Uncharacterized protein n=1 Tax=Shewanella electrodiphila TaxID=934143 RepID=A0ABT0KSY5_9GAMM|nr:hypothetical protein [Shewanella electrodiphila]MCL1046960.1 hypothetical protein [Shewanella electrodiphila]